VELCFKQLTNPAFQDVARYLDEHPGGAYVLLSVLGIDSTRIFGTCFPVFFFSSVCSTLESLRTIFSDGTFGFRSAFQYHLNQRRKRKSTIWYRLMSYLKRENSGDTENLNKHVLSLARLKCIQKYAVPHSRLAKVKILELAVGMAFEHESKENTATDGEESIDKRPDHFPQNELLAFPAMSKKYRKLAVFSEKKLIVSEKSTEQIFLFRFEYEFSEDQIWFLPGMHIELSLPSNGGDVVSRPYTPLTCHSSGHLDLIIKVYESGQLTPALFQLEMGDIITIRGPLDKETSLLNPHHETGCYPTVVMLCAGTGITPALQLTDYYLRYCKRNADNSLQSNLILFFFNTCQENIFYHEELELIRINSGGSFSFQHILTRPAADWNGLTGRVSSVLLKTTLLPMLSKFHSREDLPHAKQIENRAMSSSLASLKNAPNSSPWNGSAGVILPKMKSSGSRGSMQSGEVCRDMYHFLICGPPTFNENAARAVSKLDLVGKYVSII
jgi:NAD(P)H-flavin reductase